jgi:hypothetical protein
MSKNNSEHIWIEAGYEQFAAEGLEGIQVERLARITGRETYLEKLMAHHVHLAKLYTNELKQVKQFDPGYIGLLIKYAKQLMFTNQMIKNRHHQLLSKTQQSIDEMVDPVLSKLFADFIGFQDHLEFSTRYYNQVRYMFHAQITLENMNYPYLRNFMHETRTLIRLAAELNTKTK